MRPFLLAALLFAPHLATAQPPGHDRSVWFWQSPNSPNGSINIVGNPQREDDAISRLKAWGITTIYGSYTADGAGNPAALRAWNRKLSANGIASYLLLSETEALFPESGPRTSSLIQANFIAFNRASDPAERFTGLAFDIEPHILPPTTHGPSWKDADPLQRRIYMTDFLNFFQRTRTLLDQNGEANAPIQTSLTTWFAKLNGSIQWNNALDRDEWFHQLANLCTRISIMDFEAAEPTVILSRAKEESRLLRSHLRLALRANLGKEWATPDQFWTALQTVEQSTHQSVDIQDYALLCAANPRP